MGWDRHKLLWDGTDKHVPWTTLKMPSSEGWTVRSRKLWREINRACAARNVDVICWLRHHVFMSCRTSCDSSSLEPRFEAIENRISSWCQATVNWMSYMLHLVPCHRNTYAACWLWHRLKSWVRSVESCNRERPVIFIELHSPAKELVALTWPFLRKMSLLSQPWYTFELQLTPSDSFRSFASLECPLLRYYLERTYRLEFLKKKKGFCRKNGLEYVVLASICTTVPIVRGVDWLGFGGNVRMI